MSAPLDTAPLGFADRLDTLEALVEALARESVPDEVSDAQAEHDRRRALDRLDAMADDVRATRRTADGLMELAALIVIGYVLYRGVKAAGFFVTLMREHS